MIKKTIGVLIACSCALALGGCAKAVEYDTPTASGNETTWLDYGQNITEFATVQELQSQGGLDVVALAQDAENASYNEVRQQTVAITKDGSWLGDATLNKLVYRNVMNDGGIQTQQLYYTDLHYFKLDASLDTTANAEQVANDFIAAAGLSNQIGYNNEDTYNLATTDLDDELEIGNVTGYDVDHYMAVGKCSVNGQDGYWFVKVIGGWLRCYVTTLDQGFVVSGNVQEYDTVIASYDDLKANLLRLDANWVF
ncbi:hypothetical protein [Denitrobacterium detoxificans]|uniref:hypothetical protein n=1 Tax=Denitrobacterium detoxificans TaxID=79604 RepID=UPI0026EDC7BA|nr:hypothetical protein [Denitrobacterium detoxificans]MBE6466482.1 hypothetical protein [Denitrobacterium detoxificans]